MCKLVCGVVSALQLVNSASGTFTTLNQGPDRIITFSQVLFGGNIIIYVIMIECLGLFCFKVFICMVPKTLALVKVLDTIQEII